MMIEESVHTARSYRSYRYGIPEDNVGYWYRTIRTVSIVQYEYLFVVPPDVVPVQKDGFPNLGKVRIATPNHTGRLLSTAQSYKYLYWYTGWCGVRYHRGTGKVGNRRLYLLV